MELLYIFSICFAVAFSQECGDKPEQPPWDPADWQEQEVETVDGDSYIVGGRDVFEAGYWPWQLSLQYLSNETDGVAFYHTCGAVFIDARWALTAAHCVEANLPGAGNPGRENPANFQLVFGGWNISDITDEQILQIDRIIKHERWLPDPLKGYPNDIALLRLTEEPDMTDERIAMACIPQETDFNFTGNPDCWITGWGKIDWRESWIPDIQQEALIEVPSNEWCFERHIGYIRDTHICAGTGVPNACSGDSGGPMSCYADGQWYLAGVTSWGVVTCNTLPGVYTRVSTFWEWIELQKALNAP